jgi:Zn finger protein HypA/HybF involved in hydrogenase expression
MWCKECNDYVEPVEDDGSLYCPKCKVWLGGCKVINFREWQYKRAEKRFLALSDHLD